MVVRAPLRTKEVCEPAASCTGVVLTTKVSAPALVDNPQASAPPEEMVQGEAQVGAAVPPLVPAKTTSQEVGVWQVMGFPPLFLMEMVMATGDVEDEAPAFSEAPTMVMLEFAVALLTRL